MSGSVDVDGSSSMDEDPTDEDPTDEDPKDVSSNEGGQKMLEQGASGRTLLEWLRLRNVRIKKKAPNKWRRNRGKYGRPRLFVGGSQKCSKVCIHATPVSAEGRGDGDASVKKPSVFLDETSRKFHASLEKNGILVCGKETMVQKDDAVYMTVVLKPRTNERIHVMRLLHFVIAALYEIPYHTENGAGYRALQEKCDPFLGSVRMQVKVVEQQLSRYADVLGPAAAGAGAPTQYPQALLQGVFTPFMPGDAPDYGWRGTCVERAWNPATSEGHCMAEVGDYASKIHASEREQQNKDPQNAKTRWKIVASISRLTWACFMIRALMDTVDPRLLNSTAWKRFIAAFEERFECAVNPIQVDGGVVVTLWFRPRDLSKERTTLAVMRVVFAAVQVLYNLTGKVYVDEGLKRKCEPFLHRVWFQLFKHYAMPFHSFPPEKNFPFQPPDMPDEQVHALDTLRESASALALPAPAPPAPALPGLGMSAIGSMEDEYRAAAFSAFFNGQDAEGTSLLDLAQQVSDARASESQQVLPALGLQPAAGVSSQAVGALIGLDDTVGEIADSIEQWSPPEDAQMEEEETSRLSEPPENPLGNEQMEEGEPSASAPALPANWATTTCVQKMALAVYYSQLAEIKRKNGADPAELTPLLDLALHATEAADRQYEQERLKGAGVSQQAAFSQQAALPAADIRETSSRVLRPRAKKSSLLRCDERMSSDQPCPAGTCNCKNALPAENLVEIRTDGFGGQGLWATQEIKAGEWITWFKAVSVRERIDTTLYKLLDPITKTRGLPYTFKYHVDELTGKVIFVPPQDEQRLPKNIQRMMARMARTTSGFGQYINHSCDEEHEVNAELVATSLDCSDGSTILIVAVRAKRKIPKDWEILVKYNETAQLPFTCKCRQCRTASLGRAEGKQPVDDVEVDEGRSGSSAAARSQGAASGKSAKRKRSGGSRKSPWGSPGCKLMWENNEQCPCYLKGTKCLNAPTDPSSVEVRPLPDGRGVGVFAREKLPKHKVICYFEGWHADFRTPKVLKEVLHALDKAATDEYSIRHADQCVCVPPESIGNLPFRTQQRLKKSCYTTPKGFPYIGQYVNHKCRRPSACYCWINAPVMLDGKRIFVMLCAVMTLEEIEPDAEVFVTYYDDVEENGTPFVCNCGECPSLSRPGGNAVAGPSSAAAGVGASADDASGDGSESPGILSAHGSVGSPAFSVSDLWTTPGSPAAAGCNVDDIRNDWEAGPRGT